VDQRGNDDKVDSWQVKTLLDHYRIQQSAIQYTYRNGANVLATAHNLNATAKGKKRATTSDNEPSRKKAKQNMPSESGADST
jgi:hypothetical protein